MNCVWIKNGREEQKVQIAQKTFYNASRMASKQEVVIAVKSGTFHVSLLYQKLSTFLYKQQEKSNESKSLNDSKTLSKQEIEFLANLLNLVSLSLPFQSKASKILVASKAKIMHQILSSITIVESALDLIFNDGDLQMMELAPFLGLCIDKAIILDSSILEKYKKAALGFISNIIQSKKTIPSIYLDALQSTFAFFLDESTFEKEIASSSQKLLLRSPEVVLDVLCSIIRAAHFDTSRIFSTVYADLLLNQLKSSNESIRKSCVELYRVLGLKSSDPECISTAAQIILKGITTKNALPDQRQYFFAVIKQIPLFSVASSKILGGLETLSIKESNEGALSMLISAYYTHASELLKAGDEKQNEKIWKFVTAGLVNKSRPTSRGHILNIENLLSRDILENVNEKWINGLVKQLTDLAIKMQSSGVALFDSKKESYSLGEAMATIHSVFKIHQVLPDAVDFSELLKVALNPLEPLSVLFSDRFYSKLQNSSEQIHLIEILSNLVQSDDLFEQIANEGDVSKVIAGPLIWIHLYGSFEAKREIGARMSLLTSQNSKLLLRVSNLMKCGLVATLDSTPSLSVSMWNDVPSRCSKDLAQGVVSVIMGCIPAQNAEYQSVEFKEAVESVLVDFMLTCHHPYIVKFYGSDLWVRVCFRASIPPTFLCSFRNGEWMDSLLDAGLNASLSTGFYQSFLSLIVLCTQIAPKLIVSKCCLWGLLHSSPDGALQITQDDIQVWKTSEGQVYFDPLQKKNEISLDTKGLTKEQKWELELKKELQSKKTNDSVKRSKADQEIYDGQLLKEKKIRGRVSKLHGQVNIGLDVVSSVFDGILNDSLGQESRKECIKLFRQLITGLFNGILLREYLVLKLGKCVEPCGQLGGLKSTLVFTKFAEIMMGSLKNQLPIDMFLACLYRSFGLDESLVPEKYSKMELSELVLQVYNIISEYLQVQEHLETESFALVFSLLQAVIKKEGRIKKLKEKVYTELVMNSSDILIAHAGIEGDDTLFLPRCEMTKCFLLLIESYPRLRVAAKGGLLALTLATSHLDPIDSIEDLTSEDDEVSLLIKELLDVVLDGLLSDEVVVRDSCLASLLHIPLVSSVQDTFDVRVWMCCSDDDEEVSQQALMLWNDVHQLDCLKINLVKELIALTVHENKSIRSSAGRGLCKALENYTDLTKDTLIELYKLYEVYSAEQVPDYDAYGLVIPESLNKPDPWPARSGIALALESCVPVITTKDTALGAFQFLINQEALGDRNSTVQQQMLNVGLAIINSESNKYTKELLDLLDVYLSKPAIASKTHDTIRESTVILMGTLAHHLDSSDPRTLETIDKLIETLTTPSESVQIAVSECLPPLIKSNKDKVSSLVERLLDMLFKSEKYGHRRGAAYGLAGIVKGAGLSSLKDFYIMAHLKEAVEEKKNLDKREGALFAFETLSFTLGRVFEPYVIQILPHLLTCYGDSNQRIRDATEDACRTIMSKLSAHCVKLVLPSLLNGLQERAFRTKIGSIEVMASMSSLAPKQLGQSLPTIVPRICEALGDSHQKVQEAAKDALGTFGKVIKNPEIQELVPVLIAALVNPNAKTQTALSSLLDTTFVHYIDAPSLALLVPIIHRGMKERSAETKKKAAQIMGNMSSLTEPRDLVPYLDSLLPPLKEVLVDPVPDARATAARAFGTMVEKLGEEKFPGLVNEFLDVLQSDASTIDRSGSAQGLSEVLAGIGISRLEGLLPVILNNANSIKATTREGFTTLLVYLPATFGERFTPYIAKIVPTMLEGLADESDTVRDAALRVGQVIVRNYAKSAVNLLLPELEKGLFNDNWRIRQNSVQLIGDLIFRIAGINKQMESDDVEAEGLGTELHRTALKNALGDRYETVMASLFIVRADSSGLVRQSAVAVWKAVVANTPRTLKQILPILMNILLSSLASDSQEKRGVAARTLGDLNVIQLIIPILQEGLASGDSDTREGVCIGLCEMMNSAGRILEEFLEKCVPIVRTALVDSSSDVRIAAAQAFDILHKNMGSKAIDDVIPALLGGIKTDKEGYALEGLKEIMTIRSNVVFPVLIPTLLTKPITQLNAQALGSLIAVAGSALNNRLDTIIPTLVDEIEDGNANKEDLVSALDAIMISIEESGVYRVIGILTELINEGSLVKKSIACKSLTTFFSSTEESFEEFIPDTLTLMAGLFSDNSAELVQESWNCFNAIVQRVRKEDLDRYVLPVRNGIRHAEVNLGFGEDIPAFLLPKALSPILSIMLQGLIGGSTECKEAAAYGLGDIICRTPETLLKPYVTQITGPLIRVIGDRVSPGVKAAILSTIGQLLTKVPTLLKPFLPQLQRTFVKCLSDVTGTSAMRSKTAQCLSSLIPLQTRLDPLVLELIQGIKSADESIEPAMWESIYGLLKCVDRGSSKSINEASQTTLIQLIMEKLLKSGDNGRISRTGAAKCFAMLCNSIPLDRSRELLLELLSTAHLDGWSGVHGMLIAMERVFDEAKETLSDTDFGEVAAEKVLMYLADSKAPVVEAAIAVASQLFKMPSGINTDSLLNALVNLSKPENELVDARREALLVLKNLAKSDHKMLDSKLETIVPIVMQSVRDRTIPVKLAAERALVFILRIPLGPGVYEPLLKRFQGPSARSIGDYARRVLSKIAERDSDAEDDF